MNKLIVLLPGAGQEITVPCFTSGETRVEVWLRSGADVDADNGVVVFDFGGGHTARVDTPSVFEVRDGVVSLGVGIVCEIQAALIALPGAVSR